jgi:hypothetical protein
VSGFYILEGDAAQGPFDEAALRQRLAEGGLAWSTMSWRAGERRWTSLRRRWAARGVAVHAVAAVCGWVLGIGLAALALAMIVQLVEMPAPLRAFPLRVGAGVAAGVLALVFAAWYWKAAARSRGVPTLGSVLCALLVATGVACSLAAIGLQKKVSDDRAAMPNARMAFDAASGELRIDGNIGERFTDDLRAALDRAPGLRRVVIDSPGGFVEDAIKAGELLAARGVTVRVMHECASACSVLWAAAPRRELAFDGRIGLHRHTLDLELPSLWREDVDEDLTARTVEVMKRAGFNDAMLAHRAQTAPGDMYWVDPVALYEAGVQLAIVDADGRPVSASRAKFLAAMLGGDNPQPLHRRLVEAFAARLPQRADRAGPDLYAAWRQGDDARHAALIGRFNADARLYALASAPDAATVAWGRDAQSQMAAAVAASDTARCRLMLGVALPGDAERPGADGMVRALADLLLAAPPEPDDAPSRRAIADRAATTAVFTRVFRRRLAEGWPDRYEDWPAMSKCRFISEVYGDLLRFPQPQAAQAIRIAEGL